MTLLRTVACFAGAVLASSSAAMADTGDDGAGDIATGWAAGQDVWPAAYLDVTPAGFNAVEDIANAVLPPTIPIDADLSGGGTVIDNPLLEIEYDFGVDNLYVGPAIDDVTIVPDVDYLNMSVDISLTLATPADPTVLSFYAGGDALFGLFDFDVLDETCTMYLDPTPVGLDAAIFLSIAKDRYGNVLYDTDGNIMLDVEVEEVELSIPQLQFDDLHLGQGPGNDCIIDNVLDIADAVGLDVVELVLADVEPLIQEELTTILEDLEVTLEETFSQLVITETLPVLDTELTVDVYPRAFNVVPQGLRLELGGRFDSGEFPHPCVSRFDPGLSKLTLPVTDPRYPALGEHPVGGSHHLAILANDDWLNQALYAVWRGGLLCQTISDDASPVDLPIRIDTGLLNLLTAQGFAELFPETGPLILKTRPERPPELRMDGPSTTDITIDQLGLDFYAELDGRMVRTVGLDLAAEVGVDVTFNDQFGVLDALVDFAPEDIEAAVSFNDLLPEVNGQVESGFTTIADNLIGPLLSGALEDLSFEIPAFSGLGLSSGDILGAGPIEDFAGVFGTIGTVPYGEGPAGGCDITDPDSLSGGCDTGCGAVGVVPAASWVWMTALGAAVLRRRREDDPAA